MTQPAFPKLVFAVPLLKTAVSSKHPTFAVLKYLEQVCRHTEPGPRKLREILAKPQIDPMRLVAADRVLVVEVGGDGRETEEIAALGA
jgi:hypothetical protein